MAYIFTYLDRSSIESLQNVIVKHFNPEEISEAKESLWKAYTQSITLPYISRRDGNESAAVKDSSDIIKACHELDQKAAACRERYILR